MIISEKIRLCFLLVMLSIGSAFASTVSDTIKPIITVEAEDLAVTCNSLVNNNLTSWYNDFGGAEATDNSGNVTLVPDLTFAQALDSLDANVGYTCGGESFVVITWTAVDDCNNESLTSTTATFSTFDTTDPVFIAPISAVTIQCDENTQDSLNNWVATMADADVADSCSEPIVFTSYLWNTNFGGSGSGNYGEPINIPLLTSECNVIYNIVFFIEDQCGNSAASTGQFSIIDNELPVWSQPIVDVTVSCEEADPPTDEIFGVDACAGDLVPEVTDVSTQGTDINNPDYYNYTINRSWVTYDPCGNVVPTVQQLVTVEDKTGPTFDIEESISISCETFSEAATNFAPTNILDNCSSVSMGLSDSPLSTGCNAVIERLWTATDISGNTSTRIQIITLIDTIAPVVMTSAMDTVVNCSDLANVDIILNDWLDNNGFATAFDACETPQVFIANPGTYDINDPATFPGTLSTDLLDQGCPSNNGYLSILELDFVFYDACDNAVMTNASFGIVDTIAPVIQNLPTDVTLNSTTNDCAGIYTVELLDVTDDCSAIQSPLNFSLIEEITSSVPGDPEVPVDSILFHFGPVNLINNPANGMVNLTLDLTNVDSDDLNEYFIIKGEDGTLIDSTDVMAPQCSSSSYVITLTAAQINTWGNDGFIDLWLVPNLSVTGVFTINDVCPGASAEMNLSFEIDIQSGLEPGYSIDNGDTIIVNLDDFPFDIELESGQHTLEYFFYDCGGNETSHIQNITIQDSLPPVINCPDDVTIVLELDSCQYAYDLSFDFNVTDNCSHPIVYEKTFPDNVNDALISFKEYPTLDTFIAENVFFSFENVEPIAHSDAKAILVIDIIGDINEIGEQYEIFGENGTSLGMTSLDPSADCGFSSTELVIDQNLFNDWASNGQILITALAPEDPAISGGGINNCGPLSNGTDGISSIYAHLSYGDAEVYYSISGSTSISNTLLYPNGVDTTVTLNGGINTIEYIAFDNFGNSDTCSYEVFIQDTQDPKLNCTDHVIFVHPSGLFDYTLDYTEVVTDSLDNCGIISYDLEPSIFDCSQEGEDVNVTITATDEQGNTSECISTIRIETAILNPSFTAGICPGDTLQLFANVPIVNVPNAYTFSWTGPDGFTSILENPVIPNPDASNNGTYVLEVVGFNGCNSKGTIEVFIQQLTTPEIMVSSETECEGEEVILTATTFFGNVEYLWYEGIAPNGILLQTTTTPMLTITPTLGDHTYYVEVFNPACSTLPSSMISVSIIEPPIAVVADPFLTICEGEEIILGTNIFDPSYEYIWSGPNGYMAQGQFPPVISNATSINQGIYNLQISNGACLSDTAITQVVIFDTPETPIITGDDLYCEGASLVLSVNNITNADEYSWYLNGNLFITETDNTLFLTNAQTVLSGDWFVIIEEGLCSSDTSDIISVFIESEFPIGASNSGPVCEGDSVTIKATFIPDAEYVWEAPNGEIFPGEEITVEALSGTYTVTVTTTTGCESTETTTVFIDEIPTITALSNNSQNCMDGMTDIQFFPTIVPSGLYTYDWSGPAGFGTTIPNPVIIDASSIHNGIYTLVVTNGVCVSEPEISIVDITDIPAQPEIIIEDTYCQGDEIIISTDSIGQAMYFWNTPSGDITSSTHIITIPLSASSDEGDYSVMISVNGCDSPLSEVTFVSIQEQPNIPIASANSPVCLGDSLFFNAIEISNATYQWEGPNGFSSMDRNPFVENTSLLNGGTYRLRILQNGCPSDWNELEVEIVERPLIPVLNESSYGFCNDGNGNIEVCVIGENDATSLQEFYINNILIESSADTCIIIDAAQIDIAVANEITVVSVLNGCPSEASIPSDIIISEVPDILAQAVQNELTLCNEEEVELMSLFGPPEVNISWESLNQELVLTDINGSSTLASDLPNGFSQVVLSYSAEACINYSTDTILINNIAAPIANNDTLYLTIDLSQAINVLENDEYLYDVVTSVIQDPNGGNYTIENGFIIYTPDPVYQGEIELEYEICYVECPDLCDTGILILDIEVEEECVVPNVMTPNGDNINDDFVIPCLSTGLYPNNDIRIFNEWGDEVYQSRPYNNDWNGTYNNVGLAAGTYYYILRKGDGSSPDNGFIQIQR